MPAEMILPPCLETDDGQPRRIGVEIEFAGLSCEQAATLVRDLFGGQIEPIDPYKFEVAGTRFGTFTVELDSQYAHADESEGGEAASVSAGVSDIGRSIRNGVTTAFVAVTSLWLPVEIVAPPIPLEVLPELDRLVPALRTEGAEGSKDGLLYAFATQLNPEAPSLRAESIVAHLKAFLLLAGRLRAEIDVDLLRRTLPFTDPFPKTYFQKVIDPDYWPALPQFIDDYLETNPTRNRELDLLPLLMHIAPEQVRAKVEDELVKSRPTFHYRLPDTRLSDPTWSVVTEWNRWAEVERLAADPEALRDLGGAFLDAAESRKPEAPAEAIDAWRAENSPGR